MVCLFLFHVISAQLQQCQDNISTDCCSALLPKSFGSSWPFAVCCLLPFVSLKAQCIITYCCFSSYCSGIASTWTPLRFAKCSEIMHPTNIGYSDMNVAFQRWNTRSLEWPKSFIKVVLMSLQDCLWVLILLVALSHPVCSLMSMWPLAEGGQRWSQLKKKGRLHR